MSGKPIIGMIVPPAGTKVPPEPLALYSDDVDFIAEGLGLERLTPEGYDAVIHKVGETAENLAARGATAIALMGTSLSFYKGVEFNAQLVETMKLATGLPAMTMSDAVVGALRALGARRIVLGTAYLDSVNERLRVFLKESGFAIEGTESMDIENVEAVQSVSDDDLMLLGERAIELAPHADALFISCGGLQTLRVTRNLEDRYSKPVVSSAMAGAWGAVRMLGHSGLAPGFGRLAELHAGRAN